MPQSAEESRVTPNLAAIRRYWGWALLLASMACAIALPGTVPTSCLIAVSITGAFLVFSADAKDRRENRLRPMTVEGEVPPDLP